MPAASSMNPRRSSGVARSTWSSWPCPTMTCISRPSPESLSSSCTSSSRHCSPLMAYSLVPLRKSVREIVTSLYSIGSAPSELSIVRLTSARPSGPRVEVPAKMTSSILPPRSDLAPCSPMTHARASTTLDLPEPLGPTMHVTPVSKANVVGCAKDLKPLSVRLFRYTSTLSWSRERCGLRYPRFGALPCTRADRGPIRSCPRRAGTDSLGGCLRGGEEAGVGIDIRPVAVPERLGTPDATDFEAYVEATAAVEESVWGHRRFAYDAAQLLPEFRDERYTGRQAFAAWLGDRCVGRAEVLWEQGDGARTSEISVGVLVDERGHGLGAQLLRLAEEQARTVGREVLSGYSDVPL